MFNSKYGSILSMLLVIFIVAILGILAYFAYDALNSSSINTNAQEALSQFEKSTETVKKKTSKVNSGDKDNTVEENVESTGSSLSDIDNQLKENETVNPTTPVESAEPEKVYMEDYQVVGRIEIPKTKVDYPILSAVTKRSLEIAVAVAYGPGPNQEGNTVIFGHNYRNGLFFSNNKKLVNGDTLYITDAYGQRVKYTIYNIYQTSANDASYFTRPTEGRREVSLQTCTDDSSARIIIWAYAD